MLLLFIYAVLGVNLFANVKLNEALNERANFQTLAKAFLTLGTISTGENFYETLYSLSR